MIKFLTIALILVSNFGFSKSDTTLIKNHFDSILSTPQPRNYKNRAVLDSVASYIMRHFEKYADTTYYQPYKVHESTYKNVVAVFGSDNEETVVVGAHYDVCDHQDGADDNASGTIGLLELARMLKSEKLTKRIELVAYTLEEPPFFRTNQMGSYIHAKSLKDQNRKVTGMVCLEMIAYFDDKKGSQDYPLGILSWVYGKKGNYITLVNKFHKGKFARKFSNKYKRNAAIKTKKFSGPKSLTGIDFSDHLNYWKFGYSALMITDTSFYRNKNYHHSSDKLETLDLKRMALVIDGTLTALLKICV